MAPNPFRHCKNGLFPSVEEYSTLCDCAPPRIDDSLPPEIRDRLNAVADDYRRKLVERGFTRDQAISFAFDYKEVAFRQAKEDVALLRRLQFYGLHLVEGAGI